MPAQPASPTKQIIRAHWEAEACGVRYAEGEVNADFYMQIEDARYALEPCIYEFAQFGHARGLKVLEIGVGAGTDFSQWVKAGAQATGIDLTDAGVNHTRRRLALAGYAPSTYDVRQGDAENLAFAEASFDLVYSWGVLHHTPDTPRTLAEALRVLKPGGTLKAMVYHTDSWTAWMLWLIHGLGRGKPWRSPKRIAFERLESPGTKLYAKDEARELMETTGFSNVRVSTVLGPGDLLLIKPSSRYKGPVWRLVWQIYPRWLVRALGNRFGLYLMIEAKKPQ